MRWIWYAAALAAVPLLVLLAPLAFVVFPAIACFFLAIGPLNELASSPARCRICRYVIESREPAVPLPVAPAASVAMASVIPLTGGWRRRPPRRRR